MPEGVLEEVPLPVTELVGEEEVVEVPVEVGHVEEVWLLVTVAVAVEDRDMVLVVELVEE